MRKVAIAGILAMDCDIVILDEATSMLDPEGVEEITKLIDNIKNSDNYSILIYVLNKKKRYGF